MLTYHVLYNPHAGNGRGKEAAYRLNALLPDAHLLFRDITQIDDYGAFFHSLHDDDRVVIAGGDGTLNRFINDTAPLQIDCIITYSFLTCETAALPQTPTQTRKGFG